MIHHIFLGVTGSIAIHRALDLVSLFRKEGHQVYVAMTECATRLVDPLLFANLSGQPVLTDLFDSNADDFPHIRAAREMEIALVAPATANLLGKLAAGISDDALTTTLLTLTCPLLIAPAMNTRMWQNPFVQRNVQVLQEHHIQFVGPVEGPLACGDEGVGRLASIEEIHLRTLEVLRS